MQIFQNANGKKPYLRIHFRSGEVSLSFPVAATLGDVAAWVEGIMRLRHHHDNGYLSTAAQKCARWRRKGVPVWLREKGLEALACLSVAARIEARGA